ncbi:HEAT repeat domain-containing protein [Thermodesulfobacteriota bacterium]
MFKGHKIKKVFEKFEEVEKQDYVQAISELKQFGKSATKYVIKEFQQRKLDPEKTQLILDQLCDQSDVEELVSLIGDSFDEVRKVAKNILIKKWRKPSIPFLIEKIKSPDIHSRSNATELLATFKDPSCVPQLISMFNNANPTIKKNVLKILGKIGGQQAKKLIISALNDESWDVCHSAVQCMREMKDPDCIDPLIEKLEEKDPRIMKLTMDALGAIGDKRVAHPMINLLKDKDLMIRQKATEHLIEIGGAEIVEPIMNLMRDEDVNVRRCAVEVLNNLKDPRTSDELIRAIKDADWWVRQIATESLTSIKGDNIVNGFIAMTHDPDESLRRCAVEFFNKVHEKSAFESLIALLKDPDWWVRDKAITALGKLKDKRAIEPIAAMIDDEEVKSVVPSALARIGGPEVIKHLKKFILDENKQVRIETIKAFRMLKTAEAVPDLTECLNDPEMDVRKAAAIVLKDITGKAYKVKDGQGPSGALRLVTSKSEVGGVTVLTEAILVLDLCNSTDIAARYGDNFAHNLMKTLTDAVTPIAKRERYQFIKSTGDGFLITFPKASNSIRFAINALKTISRYNSKVDKIKKIDLRFAINLGETKLNENGDRLGVAVNMAFRVEGIKPEGLIYCDGGMTKEEMPSENWIFVTENLEKEVGTMEGIETRLIGLFELKGITGLHKIFEITYQ